MNAAALNDWSTLEVGPSHYPLPATISLDAAGQLSADEARVLAASLLNAADQLDAIDGRPSR